MEEEVKEGDKEQDGESPTGTEGQVVQSSRCPYQTGGFEIDTVGASKSLQSHTI